VMWINNENKVGILLGFPINMGSLGSGGKVASKGAAVLIEDEYRDVYKGLKMYDLAGRAADMLAEGPKELKRFISASTGCRLTLFHDHFLSGVWDYCRHPYQECPWITEEYVQSKAKEYPHDPYFVQQEFEAIWVARGDTSYMNVYVVDTKAKTVVHGTETFDFGDHPFFPVNWKFPEARKAGVDFNGPKTGHYIVMGSEDDEAIYVNKEAVVFSINELKPYGLSYNMEIESGPLFNIPFAEECTQKNVNCIHQSWDKLTIARRFKNSRLKMIIIDKYGAPFTLTNLEEAVDDANQRTPMLKKSPNQHGLDAMFHMTHKSSYKLTYHRTQTNLDYDEGDDWGEL